MTRRVGFGDKDRQPAQARRKPTRMRFVAAIFVLVYLVVLTFMILALGEMLYADLSGPQSEGPTLMAIAWLVVAAAGWCLGAFLLLRLLRGRPAREERADRPSWDRNYDGFGDDGGSDGDGGGDGGD